MKPLLHVALAACSFVAGLAATGCAPSAAPDAGTPAADDAGEGTAGDAGADDDVDAGGGGDVPVAIALPLDFVPVTYAPPLNLDDPTDVSISRTTGLHYAPAYEGEPPQLIREGRVFRLEARTHDAPGDRAGETKVWWRYIDADTNASDRFMAIQSDDGTGEYVLDPQSGWDEATGLPYDLDIDYAAWSLVKHPSEGTYALRAVYRANDDDRGDYVTDGHGSVGEGRAIRVGSRYHDLAAYFRLEPAAPAAVDP